MRKLIAGNWKMHGTSASLAEIGKIRDAHKSKAPSNADVMICPPATLIARAAAVGGVPIGGQDCAVKPLGACTGDVSAEMLKDAGAVAAIVGHSERRQYHHERDAEVAAKAEAAWRAGLMAIICIGETEAEREEGRALDVVARQIAGSVPKGAVAANTALAYEPVWAIGTGKTPTDAEIEEMHAHIRALVADKGVRILYGGSVKPSNAREILKIANVDGALVGGASLKAEDFLAIVEAAS